MRQVFVYTRVYACSEAAGVHTLFNQRLVDEAAEALRSVTQAGAGKRHLSARQARDFRH